MFVMAAAGCTEDQIVEAYHKVCRCLWLLIQYFQSEHRLWSEGSIIRPVVQDVLIENGLDDSAGTCPVSVCAFKKQSERYARGV